MGIARLQVELAHAIKTHIEKPPTEEDSLLHQQELQNLFNTLCSSPVAAIPPSLRKGALDGETVTVSAEKLDQLRAAALITQAAKLILDKKAGNQKAAVAQTRGASALLANYFRHEADTQDYSGPMRATLAAIVGSSRCNGFAHVGLQIAKSLNIPGAVLTDYDIDHTYLRLFDFHCDAWTSVPTTCLAGEFKPFSSAEVDEEYVAGQPADGVFNLHRIKQARKQLEQALGPDGIEEALLEAKRTHYGITHPVLERQRERQGVLSYSDISLDGLDEREEKEVLEAMREVGEKLDERLLEDYATAILAKPVEVDVDVSFDNLAPDVSEEERKRATDNATEFAVRQLTDDNRQALKDAARHSPKYEVDMVCSNPCMEIALPETRAADASKPVVARVRITAKLHAKPAVWNAHYHATSYNTYQTPDSSQQWRNEPPKRFIDEALAGKATAKQLGFPKKYRQQSPLPKQPIHLSETDPFIADPAAIRARNGEYLSSCMAQLRQNAGNLSQQAGIYQYAILKNVERRLENVSRPVFENVMRELAGLADSLSAQGKTLAQEILQKWRILLPVA
jgi:hypothetical protein